MHVVNVFVFILLYKFYIRERCMYSNKHTLLVLGEHMMIPHTGNDSNLVKKIPGVM